MDVDLNDSNVKDIVSKAGKERDSDIDLQTVFQSWNLCHDSSEAGET